MPLTVLGLASSPRRGGNSDRLLDQVLVGASEAGATVEKIVLSRLNIHPCVACDGCWQDGRCIVQDDFQELYDRLLRVERIVLASPIYFMALSAQAKTFIDRCQCLWARKYVVKAPPAPTQTGAPRVGLLITTAGHEAKNAARCAALTMHYFLDVLDAQSLEPLHVGGVDKKGDIENRPEALTAAFRLGQRLAQVEIGSWTSES